MTQIFEPGYLQSVFVPELPERRLGVADTARTSPSMKDFKLLVMMVMTIMMIIMMVMMMIRMMLKCRTPIAACWAAFFNNNFIDGVVQHFLYQLHLCVSSS